MATGFDELLQGYRRFQQKCAASDQSVMRQLAEHGQSPQVMVVACSDSRVDPALILQCAPGDLFVVRNVAGIIPPYEKDNAYHGTGAALEFAIQFLRVKHLVLLGHSQCGGIQALLDHCQNQATDFIANWMSTVKQAVQDSDDVNACVKQALHCSYQHCLTFPWIKEIERYKSC